MFGLVSRFNTWHKTKPGLFVFAVVELALCYQAASVAIDRGNLLFYAVTLSFLFGFLQNVFKLLQLVMNRRQLHARHR